MLPTNPKLKRQNISEGKSFPDDIISSLHDSILSQILSFLPSTEQAIRTCILSKRWRYVWTYVDKLVFHKSYSTTCRQNILFTQIVSNVLKLHQGNIKAFTLCCYGGFECTKIDVTSWIDVAIAQGVERLDVKTAFDFSFPRSMFSCKTLIDLKLNSLRNIKVNISSAPIFPCLKKLDVTSVGYDSECFELIVSQCSALEHLIVGGSGKNTIDIVSSSVKRLELHVLSHGRRRFDQKILLGVPNLEYLQISCTLPLEFTVEEPLSSLIEAHICFGDPFSQNVTVKQLRGSFERFIQLLSNVKFLRLHCHLQKFLNSVGHGLFLNLTKLEIVSNFFEWRLLVSFMESSINLEAITLKKMSTLEKHRVAWTKPKKVPICLSSSIRKISIRGCTYGYRCSEDVLTMVKYVLRTAQILERIDIYSANNMTQKIEKLPRACEKCKILLM